MSETPRHKITWKTNADGLKPTETPYGFVLRNPLSRSIPPGKTMQINLQIASNFPCLAFPVRSHADDVTVPLIIPAGQDVVVTVENKSQHTALIVEDKEALVNLFPLAMPAIASEVDW